MTKFKKSQKYLSHTFVLVLSGALELWRKPKPSKGSCAATAAADDDGKEDDFYGDYDDDNNNNNNIRCVASAFIETSINNAGSWQ